MHNDWLKVYFPWSTQFDKYIIYSCLTIAYWCTRYRSWRPSYIFGILTTPYRDFEGSRSSCECFAIVFLLYKIFSCALHFRNSRNRALQLDSIMENGFPVTLLHNPPDHLEFLFSFSFDKYIFPLFRLGVIWRRTKENKARGIPLVMKMTLLLRFSLFMLPVVLFTKLPHDNKCSFY